jgi:hypothetical protein
MKCLNCNVELTASSTKQAKYCSDKCRKAYGRRDNGQIPDNQLDSGQIISEIPDKTENGQEITDNINTGLLNGNIELRPDRPAPAGYVSADVVALPANFGQDDCQCKHCQQLNTNNIKGKLNHGSYMDAQELKSNGYIANRVTLPGDMDYIGVKTNTINQKYINV